MLSAILYQICIFLPQTLESILENWNTVKPWRYFR